MNTIISGRGQCVPGARALARFNVLRREAYKISAPLAVSTLKRRERRAPFQGLEARKMVAQGNALGNLAKAFQALKGRNKISLKRIVDGICAALTGLDAFAGVKPRVLPWATILRPCRAGEGMVVA